MREISSKFSAPDTYYTWTRNSSLFRWGRFLKICPLSRTPAHHPSIDDVDVFRYSNTVWASRRKSVDFWWRRFPMLHVQSDEEVHRDKKAAVNGQSGNNGNGNDNPSGLLWAHPWVSTAWLYGRPPPPPRVQGWLWHPDLSPFARLPTVVLLAQFPRKLSVENVPALGSFSLRLFSVTSQLVHYHLLV